MAYLSLYRKYRSQTFSALIGQDHVVRTLQNGIASGRVAHAYLFIGPRGTGKTSTARLLAKALCCLNGPAPEPCNHCASCLAIVEGANMDVFEMDAASESGVDQVRERIIEAVEYKPTMCRYRVFIIDEVHDLSAKAFDALLKTVEEPPEHVILILATTEYNKVPPTIRSRCQKYEFHRATTQDLVRCLNSVVEAEGAQVEPPAIDAIARAADGGYRDALTLLEQVLLVSEGPVTLAQVYDQLGLISDDVSDGILSAIKGQDIARLSAILATIAREGRDPRSILESLQTRLADLTQASFEGAKGESSDPTREAALVEAATRIGRQEILSLRGELAGVHRGIRDVTLPRIWLESELIRISLALNAPAPVKAAPRVEPTRSETPRAEPSPRKSEPVVPNPKAPEPISKVAEPIEPEETAPTAVREPAPQEIKKKSKVANADSGVEAAWRQVVAQLPKGTPIQLRLAESAIVEVDGTAITVEMARSQDVSWILEKPERKRHLEGLLKQEAGSPYELRFASDGSKTNGPILEAVKLPAEGQRLHDLAREVLSPKTDSKKL